MNLTISAAKTGLHLANVLAALIHLLCMVCENSQKFGLTACRNNAILTCSVLRFSFVPIKVSVPQAGNIYKSLLLFFLKFCQALSITYQLVDLTKKARVIFVLQFQLRSYCYAVQTQTWGPLMKFCPDCLALRFHRGASVESIIQTFKGLRKPSAKGKAPLPAQNIFYTLSASTQLWDSNLCFVHKYFTRSIERSYQRSWSKIASATQDSNASLAKNEAKIDFSKVFLSFIFLLVTHWSPE